jgi:hypothetical protein
MKAARQHFYYSLSHSKDLQLFLSKQEAAELYAKLGVALTHKRGKGHRTYHVSFIHKGRFWTKLHVASHAAHKRHCARKAEETAEQARWITE